MALYCAVPTDESVYRIVSDWSLWILIRIKIFNQRVALRLHVWNLWRSPSCWKKDILFNMGLEVKRTVYTATIAAQAISVALSSQTERAYSLGCSASLRWQTLYNHATVAENYAFPHTINNTRRQSTIHSKISNDNASGSTWVGIFNLSNGRIQLNVETVGKCHRNTRIAVSHCKQKWLKAYAH